MIGFGHTFLIELSLSLYLEKPLLYTYRMSQNFQLFLFGMLPELISLYNKAYYIITYILFGLAQSFAWPTEVAIMANWFGRGKKLSLIFNRLF